MLDQLTICAIATSPGMGAIATIRLSGEKALKIADSVFQSPKSKKKLADQKPNTLHFGSVTDENELIDEVVVSIFRTPHSFTGEDVVEITCHGSVYIQQRILQLLISKGARMALPGEFTQRAFLNGKMDLSQAEAVADLIASTNRAAQKVAINQMRGGFSSELSKLRGELLHFIAMIELELDFSEEDVEFADRTQLKNLVSRIEEILRKLKNSFQLGNVIKNGIPVAIVGETNVGKSTLLNALLNEEKAIVSDIHGTTRDVIEDVVNIHGTAFRFFDTAGIRETTDEIETLGIERSYSKLDLATIVILVVDTLNAIEIITERVTKIRSRINDQHLIIAANKSDIGLPETIAALKSLNLLSNEKLVFIAAKQKRNLDELIQEMQHAVSLDSISEDAVIVTNLRHFEALSKALESIERVQIGLDNLISGDFLAQDIRECLYYLGEITGEISNDEILGHIFKNFCIGK
ncbi:GTPase and tRNA-U34 5-formylation enzyme TrmE [Aquipluma nitroreducens]|uniref:tRNA modification GTPase MnmE n=1 Tax=Aquipluma nitroreducens TaxID=2010828 RepID=A0A5K7SHH1_9BACT|nr:tRNA uridine-5-carboxymethylaminomethyl(34) synthesis GTPase MnmE [Aquipluma nitroreducens]BBE20794.1 GTPase and tRNA-U34 5-formylation enzyme TrmE [Aquipluma nitroreducens]